MTIPLVGQPIDILSWTLVLNVLCKCDHPTVVTLIVKQNELGRTTDLGLCPRCARPLQIRQMIMNAQNQLEFGIEVGERAPALAGQPS